MTPYGSTNRCTVLMCAYVTPHTLSYLSSALSPQLFPHLFTLSTACLSGVFSSLHLPACLFLRFALLQVLKQVAIVGSHGVQLGIQRGTRFWPEEHNVRWLQLMTCNLLHLHGCTAKIKPSAAKEKNEHWLLQRSELAYLCKGTR